MSFTDHFGGHAAGYAAHRPTYPAALFAFLAGAAPGRDLAWDCGTGSGQAATGLAEEFAAVVATDPSAGQLAHARAHPRVTYRPGDEGTSGLADRAADLVTAAQAAHWFDLDRFYAEVRRVARPGGLVALWTYGLATISPAVDAVLLAFYRDRVGRYWPAERRHVETEYRDLPFPFEPVPAPPFSMTFTLDRPGLVAYVGTWSAVARCLEAEGRDPLPDLERALAAAWPDASDTRTIRLALTLLLGRVG